jgi:GTP pyrophosphokinase
MANTGHDIVTVEEILDACSSYIKKESNIELIVKAYEFGKTMHEGQFRKSGEPYINHPLHVALILASLNVGPKTIAAGILHDVLEDTDVSFDELAELFDEEVATLVDGVTKLTQLKFSNKSDMMAHNHQKIFVGMSKDVRVIIIKLADRLHNMRTLGAMPYEKQVRIANETIEVYTPVAHRLGMYKLKSELEDLSFRYLKPEMYYQIVELLNQKKNERENNIELMTSEIAGMLKDHNIKYEITGRAKNIYSIYKKMAKRNKKFNEIYDLLAIRIIVDTELECYGTLGLIHAKWRPLPGRFKDYIAMPKPNMYQSLHTTVIGPNGQTFEVQIRTHEMDLIADHGVASHWAYKENKKITSKQEQAEIVKKLSWFRSMVEIEDQDIDAKEYMDTIKMDVFNANVYVFTPAGDVIDLPKGATPIDFAYRIHTEVGHKMVGAIVNGQMVPLNYEMHTGDVCEIKTNKQSYGPSEDWLKIVKTHAAVSKIRQFFSKQRKVENIDSGKEQLIKEIRSHGKSIDEVISRENVQKVYNDHNFSSLEEIYHAIGSRGFTAKQMYNKLMRIEEELTDEKIEEKINKSQTEQKRKSENGIIVEGIDNIMISVANCCKPIPGDSIVGFISKGQGIKVHRRDCPNINSGDRLIDVEWDFDFSDKKYSCDIRIKGLEREGALMDIIKMISITNTNVSAVTSKVSDDILTVNATLTVKDSHELLKVVDNLKKVKHIHSVERIIQ